MGSYEWMELQTLSAEIAAARSRLVAARSAKDHRRARVLEEEIAAAEGRRERLVVHITSNLVGGDATDPAGAAADGVAAVAAAAASAGPLEMPVDQKAERTPQSPVAAEPIDADGAVPPAVVLPAGNAEGGLIVWDKLTPGDIGRAKSELGARRAETLARHAVELQQLEAEHLELQTLEQAIAVFMQRFTPAIGEGVVQIEDEREERLRARS